MAGTPPPVPGYDPNAAAPSAAGAAAAPGTTTDPTQFNLKGFNTPFKLQTVQPGTAVPTGTTIKSKSLSNAQARVLGEQGGSSAIPVADKPNTQDVVQAVQEFDGWDTNKYNQFKDQAFQLGLTSSKSASKTQVALAWQTVVETAAASGKSTKEILDQAGKAGNWNAANFQTHPSDVGATGTGNSNSGPDTTTTTGTTNTSTDSASTSSQNTTTQTSYISYMDPATAQGTISDVYMKLMGRAPTSKETQAFLTSLYTYENNANSGKYETNIVLKDNQKFDDNGKVVDKTTGQAVSDSDIQVMDTQDSRTNTNVQKNVVNQRGIGAQGVQYLAQQQAMQDPEYATHQASTTYLKAMMDAIRGPGSGM